MNVCINTNFHKIILTLYISLLLSILFYLKNYLYQYFGYILLQNKTHGSACFLNGPWFEWILPDGCKLGFSCSCSWIQQCWRQGRSRGGECPRGLAPGSGCWELGSGYRLTSHSWPPLMAWALRAWHMGSRKNVPRRSFPRDLSRNCKIFLFHPLKVPEWYFSCLLMDRKIIKANLDSRRDTDPLFHNDSRVKEFMTMFNWQWLIPFILSPTNEGQCIVWNVWL